MVTRLAASPAIRHETEYFSALAREWRPAVKTSLAFLILFCLFSGRSDAQRGGHSGGTPPGFYPPPSPAIRPSLPDARPVASRAFSSRVRDQISVHRSSGIPWVEISPESYSDGPLATDDAVPPYSLIVMPSEPMPPPEPPNPVLHQYHWPASVSTNVFSLVSKDNILRLAVAVWLQDGTLHYLGQDGAAGAIDPDSLNREATSRANAAGGLRLHLPPAAIAK